MLNVCIGVCAYNEEKNIGKLLKALINQETRKIKIKSIFVVSSGSTDRTNDIVKEFSRFDSRVKLITQPRREGKASAVNEFIRNADAEICVLESADTIPLQHTIEKLCLPFFDKTVGMTGGRPIPTNDKRTFMGYVGHLIWELHHEISLDTPKLGELIAFRNIIDEIPDETAVDEAWIEAKIRKMGYKIVYVPNAICYNRSPETVRDLIKQRRRIYAGHLYLKSKLNYEVSTMRSIKVVSLLMRNLNTNPRALIYTTGAILLEVISRALAYYDYMKGNTHIVWDIAKTTKDLKIEEYETIGSTS